MAAAMVSGLLLCGAGCAERAHLTPSHGRAYRAAIQRQSVNPAPARTRPVRGLDPQEAAIIADTYRRGLAPKGADPGEDATLILAPSRAAAGGGRR